MPTFSLKSIAATCFDQGTPLSVKRHIFGYLHGPISTPLAQANDSVGQAADRTLSLRSQIELINGPTVDLSIIIVGHDVGYSGWWSVEDARYIQTAIDVTRELYSQVNLGIRRLHWYYIPPELVPQFQIIDGAGATDLTIAYSGLEDTLDVFYVPTISNAGGFSNAGGGEGGPCDKDVDDQRSGSVIERKSATAFWARWAGILLAHELGHYLSLQTFGDIGNVMGVDPDGNGIDSINSGSTNLTQGQGDQMKEHCSVQEPCVEG